MRVFDCFQIETRLPHSEKLKNMIKAGIPHSIRPHIWMRTSGAMEKKHKSETTYKDIVKASSNDLLMTSKQIEKVGDGKNFCSSYSFLVFLTFLKYLYFSSLCFNNSYRLLKICNNEQIIICLIL